MFKLGSQMCAGALTVCFALASISVDATSVSSLKTHRSQLEKQAALMRSKRIEKLRAVDKLNNYIDINQERLFAARQNLNETQGRYRNNQKHVQYLNQRIDNTLTELRGLAQASSKRLKRIYMGERLNMLQFALNARNANEFLDRLYYEQRIIAQDKLILKRLREKGIILHNQRRELTKQQQLIAQNIQQIDQLKENVESRIELDKDLRDKYAEDAAYYAMAENKLLSESRRIQQSIQSLIAAQTRRGGVIVRGTGRLSWPLIGSLRSRFGYRRHPIHRTYLMHTGLDISGGTGASIRAADGGRVIYAGWRGGYGKVIMIYHGGNLVTLYGHMSGYAASSGQNVQKGQVIGYVGSTGYSTGPHLHFETRVNGIPVDPLPYL
jgi:murein DD-endopeptidase MepM/ murein hydrolase activator NlpD